MTCGIQSLHVYYLLGGSWYWLKGNFESYATLLISSPFITKYAEGYSVLSTLKSNQTGVKQLISRHCVQNETGLHMHFTGTSITEATAWKQQLGIFQPSCPIYFDGVLFLIRKLRSQFRWFSYFVIIFFENNKENRFFPIYYWLLLTLPALWLSCQCLQRSCQEDETFCS